MLKRETARQQVHAVQDYATGRSEAMISVMLSGDQAIVPAAVYARIEEWARWVRVRSSLDPRGHCRSIEYRYEAQYPDAERSIKPLEHDLQAVLAVERVVCTKLPIKPRELIKKHFVLRIPAHDVARSLSIHRAAYADEFKRSVLMVKNSLTIL